MKRSQNNTIHIKLNKTSNNLRPQSDELDMSIGNGWVMPNQSEAPILEDVRDEEDFNNDLNPLTQNRVYQIFNNQYDETLDDQEEEPSELKKRLIPKSTVVMKFFLPVVVALVTGSSLGFGALHILENQNMKQVNNIKTIGNTGNSEDSKSGAVVASSSKSTYERNLTVSMVQAGVFSSKEAAETQKSTLPVNVPSVIIEQDQKYIIFIGIADKIENAKTFSLNYKKINLESFWKDVPFVGPTKESFSKKEKEKIDIITNNFKMLRAGLVSEKFGNPVMEMHATEVELENDTEVLAELIMANNEALKVFDSYKKTPTALGLIKFEQKLLEVLKAYSEM
ncbi:MAG: hypothetical protein K0R71_2253 [Bacillales bacterium]|nr:hypothetical protein [Bacillales bacterium]